MQRQNLVGQTFGQLSVLERDEELSKKRKRSYWRCQCSCGNIKSIEGYSLKSGATKSCGCLRFKDREDLTNKRFGYLTVLGIDEEKTLEKHTTYWKCLCDCGVEKSIKSQALKSGAIISCGCYSKKRSQDNYKDITGQKFGKLTPIRVVPDERSGAFWLCQCDCGNTCVVKGINLRNSTTMSCGCLNSKSEAKLQKIFDNLSLNYIPQYTFEDLKGKKDKLRFDFAIFINNKLYALIEYQGEQHYKEEEYFGGTQKFLETKEYDQKKRDYCKTNDIKLIEIPYWDKEKINEKYITKLLNLERETI